MSTTNQARDRRDRESQTPTESGEWCVRRDSAVRIEFANIPSAAHRCAIDLHGQLIPAFYYAARRILLELGVCVLGITRLGPEEGAPHRIVVVDPCGLPLATQQRQRTRLALIGLAASFGGMDVPGDGPPTRPT